MTLPGRASNGVAWPRNGMPSIGGRESSFETGLIAIGIGAVAIVLGLVAAYVASSTAERGLLILAVAIAPFVAMAVGQIRYLLLAVVVLDIPFQWDAHLGWRQDAAELGATGGLSISVTTLALGGLYALWFGELLVGAREDAKPGGIRLAAPLLVYVGFSAISLLAATDLVLAQFKLFVLVQSLLLFIYVAGTVRTERAVRFVVGTLLLALLAQSLLVIGGRVAGFDVAFAGLSTTPSDPAAAASSRAAGTVGSPTAAAAFFSFLLAPAIAVMISNAGRWQRRLAVAAFSSGAIALVLTLSRGGWIAAGLAITLLLAVSLRRRWLKPRALMIPALVLILLAVPFVSAVGNRLTSDDGGSAGSRLPLTRLSLDIIEDQPVRGVGLNNFVVAIPQYTGPEFTGEFIFVAHNKYLLVWAEAGIAALLAFVFFLLVTIRRGWRASLSSHPYVAPVALGFTVAIVGQMVHMTVEIFQSRPQVQLLWLVAALLAAMAAMTRTNLKEPQHA